MAQRFFNRLRHGRMTHSVIMVHSDDYEIGITIRQEAQEINGLPCRVMTNDECEQGTPLQVAFWDGGVFGKEKSLVRPIWPAEVMLEMMRDAGLLD